MLTVICSWSLLGLSAPFFANNLCRFLRQKQRIKITKSTANTAIISRIDCELGSSRADCSDQQCLDSREEIHF